MNYQRLAIPFLSAALADSPVVLLNGARQTGKTTLVKSIESEARAQYFTLDDTTVLSAAKADPVGFVAGLAGSVIIDEVQHAPELFRAIKLQVDRNRAPGRFLLTGSANALLLPQLSESLAGRMEILTLWPLAQAEIEGAKTNFVEALFDTTAKLTTTKKREPAIGRADFVRRIARGGYPEPLTRSNEARRQAWFKAYLTTILQRDVRDIANIQDISALPRLLAMLATRSSGLLNMADISRGINLPYSTLERYMSLLETTFLLCPLPAWTADLGRRLMRAPKTMLADTGLAVAMLGQNEARLAGNGELFGALLENFVAMELRKLAGFSNVQPRLFHFRTAKGNEVDVVLEDAAGNIAGIECKAGATVTSDDFKGLRFLREATGSKFVRGAVLYAGDTVIPFDENLHAVPIDRLWS